MLLKNEKGGLQFVLFTFLASIDLLQQIKIGWMLLHKEFREDFMREVSFIVQPDMQSSK